MVGMLSYLGRIIPALFLLLLVGLLSLLIYSFATSAPTFDMRTLILVLDAIIVVPMMGYWLYFFVQGPEVRFIHHRSVLREQNSWYYLALSLLLMAMFNCFLVAAEFCLGSMLSADYRLADTERLLISAGVAQLHYLLGLNTRPKVEPAPKKKGKRRNY